MNSNYFEKNKNKILNLYKEQKFLELIKLGDKLIKLNSNDAQLIYLLGLSSINLQKFIDAEKYFEKLISIKKKPEIFYTYGNIKKKLKKYNEAIVSFENAIKLKPDFSETEIYIIYGLGCIFCLHAFRPAETQNIVCRSK